MKGSISSSSNCSFAPASRHLQPLIQSGALSLPPPIQSGNFPQLCASASAQQISRCPSLGSTASLLCRAQPGGSQQLTRSCSYPANQVRCFSGVCQSFSLRSFSPGSARSFSPAALRSAAHRSCLPAAHTQLTEIAACLCSTQSFSLGSFFPVLPGFLVTTLCLVTHSGIVSSCR